MFHNLVNGLTVLGNLDGMLYLFGGCIFGMIFGVIPGLGGAVVLSIILAFIYHVSLVGTVCLFLGTHAASYYSASVTSILLNTPAHPEAFAVTFDGFPMAQRGEAGRALGISAAATCLGGLVGCIALVAFIPLVKVLPTLFHPPEFVALVLIALLLVGTLGTDKVSKALVSAGIGIMISAVGTDPVTAVQRYTFNSVGLIGGISLVALALGLFSVPQMTLVFGTATTIARQDMMGNDIEHSEAVGLQKGFSKQIFGGIMESLHHWVALIRSGLVGVVTGIIPGIGGFAANFLSYGIAQQFSKRRELFGTGIPEGIIAPEGSSLSKEAGSLIPIIGLGIPGGVGGALFVAALTIKGVRLGPDLLTSYPSLPYEMMWVILLSGFIGTAIGLLASPWLAKITTVPGPLLVPFIMVLSAIGPFVADISFFAVVEGLIFTFIGFLLRRLKYSLAAFAIGLVLGPTLENNIFLTHEIFPGWTYLERPFSDVLFAIAIGVLLLKGIQLHKDAKKIRIVIEEEDPIKRAELELADFKKHNPYPQLAFLTSLTLFGLCLAFTVYGITQYRWNSAIFPTIGGILATLGALWQLPLDTVNFIRSVKLRRIVKSTVTRVPEEVRYHPVTGKKLPKIVHDKSWGFNGQYTREAFALIMYSGLIGGMFLFGFLWSVPVFVVGYGIFATRRVMPSIRSRILYSIIGAAVMWGGVYEVLNILHLTYTPAIHF